MMADWAEQYLAALRARDEVEKANINLYEHCMIIPSDFYMTDKGRCEIAGPESRVGEETGRYCSLSSG